MRKGPAKVLLVHNAYQQPGGEDQVFASEAGLLEANGHRVVRYTAHNDEANEMAKLDLAKTSVWNATTYRELRALIRQERPQVTHFHNTFPIISPAAYYAARAERVPVVQTLHNYRLLCPNALFFRDGGVCEDCLGKAIPWPGTLHACYRGSRPASGTIAGMLSMHRALGTWRKAIDVYIALTEFARRKFVQGGLPAEKVAVKPNFVLTDPGNGGGGGDYFLFVGRLSKEKGVEGLLSAWERLGNEGAPLKIVGDGPLAPEVARAAEGSRTVEWLGRRRKDEVLGLMKMARALIFPSIWYEGFPMVIAEAYGVGLPVIASDLGSMSSLVDHGRTGFHFRPGDWKGLADIIERTSQRPQDLSRMRRAARDEFEEKYTAEQNYRILSGIYERALGAARP